MRPYVLLGAAALVASSPAPTGLDFGAIENAPAATGPAIGVASQDSVYDSASAARQADAAASADVDAQKRSLAERTYCWYDKRYCPSHNNGHHDKPKPPSGGNKPQPPPSHEHEKPHPPTGPGHEKPQPPPGHEHEKPHPPPGPGHEKPHPPPGPGHEKPHPPQPSSTSCDEPQPPAPTSTSTDCDETTTSATLITTTSAPTTSHEVPSSCTPVSWTNTFAFTTDPACPTPFEVGTYCGFINPEDPCAIQPDGFGPVSSPDTVDAFRNNEVLHNMAKSASDPSGYANTFKDLSAAVNANSYLGYRTLETYDVQGCADWCDDKDLCTAFNIYIERDPKWNPEQCSCDQPDSITNYKCSLWGSGVEPEAANNGGQNRGDFEVAIIGSNGYAKTNETEPETPEGCEKPQKCPAVHDHSSSCIGEHFFPGPYDVSVCAKYAHAHNEKNKHHSKSSHCSFFNAFMIKEDHVAKGTYCKLFTQQYPSKAATWVPGWFKNKWYSIESSWSYCIKK
ncbi:hypothetical protein CC79DRAFT_1369452 [Sarocladium strictum]